MIKSCMELERLYGSSKCKCAQYRKHFSCGECERQSVSPHSPGLVKDEEILIRVVFPVQIDGGHVSLSSLVGTDGRGVSVIREAYVTKEDLALKKRVLASGRSVTVDEVRMAKVLCREIRKIRRDGKQAFEIYDSASKTDRSHADICRAACVAKNDPERKIAIQDVQEQLMNCFLLLPD